MTSAEPDALIVETEEMPRQVPLRAGPLALFFERGGLRYIRFGDHEVLRRIYVAVRDAGWGTVPAQIANLEIAVEDDGFSIRFTSVHHRGDVHFEWEGLIDGSAEGAIDFRMSGVARSTFWRNRIGICVLHPTPECAGRPCVVETADGGRVHGKFPSLVAPHQPFKAVRAITHEVVPGLRARVSFHGDVFEMEDQRNWTDASFKTYSTPLELPFPVQIVAGTTITQSVALRLAGSSGVPRRRETENVFSIRSPRGVPVPRIGLGLSSLSSGLETSEIAWLQALKPSHIRFDLDLSDPERFSRLAAAKTQSAQMGIPVEAALFLPESGEGETLHAMEMLREIPAGVVSLLVFDSRGNAAAPELIDLVRQHATPIWSGVRVGSGTNGNFAELNRKPPAAASVDFFCYSANPQVHAFDNATLVENLAGLRETVESAGAFARGIPCAISPVTLRPRSRAVATGLAEAAEAEGLPQQVDPRQFSLFGAGWTACSLACLAATHVCSVTYYETTGWCGVIETERGTPAIARFGVPPGSVFPLYHVLADIAEFVGGEILKAHSRMPLSFDGLVLRKAGRLSALVCSWCDVPQIVRVAGVVGDCVVRRLHAAALSVATTDPRRFRSSTETFASREHDITLPLEPFEVVRIDWRVK